MWETSWEGFGMRATWWQCGARSAVSGHLRKRVLLNTWLFQLLEAALSALELSLHLAQATVN